MDWKIIKRGHVTYYTRTTNSHFSDLVVRELDDGDLEIHFVGMTGAYAATNQLGLEDVALMDPAQEIPRLFDTWEKYVREAGICESLADLDFLEIHSFGAAPKEPNPITDPSGYAAEKKRIREAYAEAYAAYWREKMPDNGLPVRFTVYLEELPDSGASYEMGATALYQRSPEPSP